MPPVSGAVHGTVSTDSLRRTDAVTVPIVGAPGEVGGGAGAEVEIV